MAFFQDLKIRSRLLVCFGVLLAMMMALSIQGIRSVGSTFDRLKSVFANNVMPLKQLGEVSCFIQGNRVLLMDTMLNQDPANLAERADEMGRILRHDLRPEAALP